MQAVYRILTDLVVLVDAAFRWGLVWWSPRFWSRCPGDSRRSV